jgi:tetratricopeptide (TPR) repeat protein
MASLRSALSWQRLYLSIDMLPFCRCQRSSLGLSLLMGIVAITAILSFWLGAGQPVWADDAVLPNLTTNPVAPSLQELQELQDLRTEKRFKGFIDQRLANSPEVQDRIELEVDRAFARTTTLLNILLVILTSLPVIAALGIWLLRRSVIGELVAEVRAQLETEVFAQLKQQKLSTIAEIERTRVDSLGQVAQMLTDAQAVLDELKAQIAIANQDIDQLKSEAASQLETMVSDAQQVKDQTIQELTGLLPGSTQDTLSPDVQPRVGTLTTLLESLKAAIPQITFSASDYLKQGNALFFESRYDDAIAAYDRAIALNPELYEAWFTKASTLMMGQRYEEASQAYQFATQLKPESYDAWMGQGNALRKSQHNDTAIAAFSEAIALKPEDPLAWFNRGNAKADQGDLSGAIADYDQALVLKPDFAKAALQREQVLQQNDDPS